MVLTYPDKSEGVMSPERLVKMANKINTTGTNKEGVAMKEKLIELIKNYDIYCFERSGWEGTVAEAQNNKIKKEFFEVLESLGYRMSNKDFMDIMNAVHRLDARLTAEEVADKIIKKEDKAMMNQNKKPAVNNKEVTGMDAFMKKHRFAFDNAKNNFEKATILHHMLDEIEQNKIKKEVVIKLAQDMLGINKKSKNDAMVAIQHEANRLYSVAEAEEDAKVTVTEAEVVNSTEVTKVVNSTEVTDTENEVVYSEELFTKILKRVIIQADKNNRKNFISAWMFTSIVSELVIGKPSKGYVKGQLVNFREEFTEAQKLAVENAEVAFFKRIKFFEVRNSYRELVGYRIPAKFLVYGRHMFLGVACVYHLEDKATKTITEYLVSRNGIKDIDTGVITPLDNEGYVKLDNLYKFIK